MVIQYGAHQAHGAANPLGTWTQHYPDPNALSALGANEAWQAALTYLVGRTVHLWEKDGAPIQGWMWWLKRLHSSGLILSPAAVQMRFTREKTGEGITSGSFSAFYLVFFTSLLSKPQQSEVAPLAAQLREAFASVEVLPCETVAKGMWIGPEEISLV